MLNALLLGVFLGIVSGLTPGIHNNTFAALIVAYLPLLSNYFTPSELAIVVFANAIVHSIVDIVPSVLIGVPEEDTAIAVLPAHEMILDGKGFVAIANSALSSLFSILISIPVFLAFLAYLNSLYDKIYNFTPYFLILASLFIILSERAEIFEGSFAVWRKRFYALLVFLISGFLGFVAFEHQSLAELNVASSIFIPLLTGLFAAPTLIIGFKTNKIPKQDVFVKIPSILSILSGCVSGALVSLFPAVSSGVATVMASAGLKDREKFISALSSANTANAFLCFAVFLSVGKVRSGAAAAFAKLSNVDIELLLLVGIASSLAAVLIVLTICIFLFRIVEKLRFDYLSFSVLISLLLIVYILTGIFGLAIFISAIPIGLSTMFLKVRRISCMGCLMLPLMLKFFAVI